MKKQHQRIFSLRKRILHGVSLKGRRNAILINGCCCELSRVNQTVHFIACSYRTDNFIFFFWLRRYLKLKLTSQMITSKAHEIESVKPGEFSWNKVADFFIAQIKSQLADFSWSQFSQLKRLESDLINFNVVMSLKFPLHMQPHTLDINHLNFMHFYAHQTLCSLITMPMCRCIFFTRLRWWTCCKDDFYWVWIETLLFNFMQKWWVTWKQKISLLRLHLIR